MGGPALIQTNFKSKTLLPLINCGPTEIVIPRGTPIGQMETIFADGAQQIDVAEVSAAIAARSPPLPGPPSPARAQQIVQDLTLTVPDQCKQQYLNLLLSNHDIFSIDKNDLGQANNFKHKIDLKNKAPVYIPQYRLADTHKTALNAQIDEWLKMGVIQPSNSRYNSPIFVVPKKNGENRYVLDNRALNANSHDDRYTMRTVDECIAEIGKSGSTIFSTMDLSSGYHQMLLKAQRCPATAFTAPIILLARHGQGVARHIAACQRCQARRKDVCPIQNLLTPLPQCTALNQRVHMDLFGPLKTSSQGKKFVLCLTDAFTKYAVMLAIDNKEAVTVAKAIFDHWICKFGTPLEFVSDNGKEFCNNLAKELYALLQIKHSTTTPYWPQCNSQAEVANKIIQKYLASFVDATTLDWPLYMAPMAFAYNTSVHRLIKTTPFFLTYGVEPRYPSFPNPDVQRYYGESPAAEWYNTLQHCRHLAATQNMHATDQAEQHYNTTARQHSFVQGQMVWLNETNYLGRNRKLSPNWTGPHLVLRTLDNGVVELLFKNRRLRVNVGRLKPVTPALPNASAPQPPPLSQSAPPPLPAQQPPPPAPHPPQQHNTFDSDDDFHRRITLLPQFLPQPGPPPQLPPPPPPPPNLDAPPVLTPAAPAPATAPPAKRARRRPRKDATAPPSATPPQPAPHLLPQQPHLPSPTSTRQPAHELARAPSNAKICQPQTPSSTFVALTCSAKHLQKFRNLPQSQSTVLPRA